MIQYFRKIWRDVSEMLLELGSELVTEWIKFATVHLLYLKMVLMPAMSNKEALVIATIFQL